MSEPFWKTKHLAEMTSEEWELLCDGCGRCCLVKLEDEDTGEVFYTDVHCRLLDLSSCRCRDYAQRTQRVPGCIALDPKHLDRLWTMPPSCAYRRLAEGRGLPDWHHLVCGDPQRVLEEGHAVRGRAVSENDVDAAELEDRLVEWPILED